MTELSTNLETGETYKARFRRPDGELETKEFSGADWDACWKMAVDHAAASNSKLQMFKIQK
jgi:hypothetical protein